MIGNDVCVFVFCSQKMSEAKDTTWLGRVIFAESIVNPQVPPLKESRYLLGLNSTPKKNDNNAIFTHMHPHDPSCTKLKMFENRAVSENHLSIQQWLPLVLEP